LYGVTLLTVGGIVLITGWSRNIRRHTNVQVNRRDGPEGHVSSLRGSRQERELGRIGEGCGTGEIGNGIDEVKGRVWSDRLGPDSLKVFEHGRIA
jgi:hypothetical protein